MQLTKLPDPNLSELKQPQCRPIYRLMKEHQQQDLTESQINRVFSHLTAGIGSDGNNQLVSYDYVMLSGT